MLKSECCGGEVDEDVLRCPECYEQVGGIKVCSYCEQEFKDCLCLNNIY